MYVGTAYKSEGILIILYVWSQTNNKDTLVHLECLVMVYSKTMCLCGCSNENIYDLFTYIYIYVRYDARLAIANIVCQLIQSVSALYCTSEKSDNTNQQHMP